jgi:hypothetical protein
MHAYDNDVEGGADLLPRALFMTALVRLCMCDLFIHGTGGARYDRAMEIWMEDWLGIEVGSIAVTTADLHLPLVDGDEDVMDVTEAIARSRKVFHDPEGNGDRESPGPGKRRWLESINCTSRKSSERKAAFLAMHEALAGWRRSNPEIEETANLVERSRRVAADATIASRRDWAFPLYPQEMLAQLSDRMQQCARQDRVRATIE